MNRHKFSAALDMIKRKSTRDLKDHVHEVDSPSPKSKLKVILLLIYSYQLKINNNFINIIIIFLNISWTKKLHKIIFIKISINSLVIGDLGILSSSKKINTSYIQIKNDLKKNVLFKKEKNKRGKIKFMENKTIDYSKLLYNNILYTQIQIQKQMEYISLIKEYVMQSIDLMDLKYANQQEVN